METVLSEMRLFDDNGRRLYLTAAEREAFLLAAKNENREKRIFCNVLHFTGCRPSEALELTPGRIQWDEKAIIFRTLKKRKVDNQGREKKPQYRKVPVPGQQIEEIDLVFDLLGSFRKKDLDTPFWSMSRTTAWRTVRKVMAAAGITGPQGSPKGLRHSFAIAMLEADPPVPLNILADLLGHSSTKTTEIYLQAVGAEKRKMVLNAWR